MTCKRIVVDRARLEDLATFRAFIVRACAEVGTSEAVCDALTLATDEVCTNILTHGYAGRDPGPIIITFDHDATEAVVTIADVGRRFDASAVPTPRVDAAWDERPLGGLGLFLARRMVDELRYDADGTAGNRVTLVKRLYAAAPEP